MNRDPRPVVQHFLYGVKWSTKKVIFGNIQIIANGLLLKFSISGITISRRWSRRFYFTHVHILFQFKEDLKLCSYWTLNFSGSALEWNIYILLSFQMYDLRKFKSKLCSTFIILNYKITYGLAGHHYYNVHNYTYSAFIIYYKYK